MTDWKELCNKMYERLQWYVKEDACDLFETEYGRYGIANKQASQRILQEVKAAFKKEQK